MRFPLKAKDCYIVHWREYNRFLAYRRLVTRIVKHGDLKIDNVTMNEMKDLVEREKENENTNR